MTNTKKSKRYKGFDLSRKILKRIPPKYLPYIWKWNQLKTAQERIEIIQENIEKVIVNEVFEPMVSINLVYLFIINNNSLPNGERPHWEKIEMVKYIGCFIFPVLFMLKIRKLRVGV